MNTENRYQETDLGNVSPNPRGEYVPGTEYEYLDLVTFEGGSYICIAELGATTSISPESGKNTDFWQCMTIPGDMTPEYVAMHDRVVNLSEQVGADAEEVRAAEQNVSGMKENVTQMQEQTRQSAESAERSKDSAAGYAASADASRQAAETSEQNINAQVTGFDAHVAEKTSESEQSIEAARIAANKAMLAQQEQSVGEVARVGGAAVSEAQTAARVATEKASAASESEKNAKASETAAKLSETNATKMAEQVAADKEQVAYDRTAVENAKQEMTGSVAQIEQNTQGITELKGDLGEFTKKEIGTNLLPPDTEEGTYNLSTGEKENNSSIVRTPNKTKIPIGLLSINIMINKPCNRYLAMLFYKADGAYLGYKTVDLEGKTQATFNVFDGSEYITIWIGDSTYSFDHVCVYSGSLISEFQPYERKTVVVKGGLEYDLLEKLNNIDETLYNKNLFSGKTIVNFGDSIFGNNDSDTSTSNEIAKHLKATVLNCGFGGTRMSDSRGSNREWSNFDAPNLINAVVNGDFSAQENAISQGLPGGTPGYFAYRLRDLKAINFNDVDIITLNQGTNDYTSGVAIDNNDNLEDLTKYKGAIRYITKNILSKYPHIDIFLVSPTWRYWKKSDGSFDYDSNEYKVSGTELHNLRDYAIAMREVAEELNIKFIDCYNIGINKYNCSLYFPSDDGTHHNEFGRAKLGEHIARQLLSN